MSLRTRIAAVAGLAVAVAVVAAAGIIYVAVRSELRGEIEDALRSQAQALAGFSRGEGPAGRERRRGPRFDGLRAPGPAPFGGAPGYVQLVTADGVVAGPRGAAAQLPVSARARAIARGAAGEDVADLDVGDTHVLVLTRAVGTGAALQVARPLTEVDRQLERVLTVLIIVGGAGIALAVALGAVVARAALAPIAGFTRRTEALTTQADLSQRMEVQGSDELARLAASFNTALDALERSVQAQRHLVADASHELRTPLASLRTNIQVLEDADRLPEHDRAALRADIIGELDELTALVGDVVELARGAQRDEPLDDVRVDEVLHALVQRARRRAGERVDLRVSAEPTIVAGEPERISRAVSNLLDNAIKWSPPGGRVDVELAGGTLSVRDHGPGFAPEDLPHVFERFYRADGARGMPGSGLGLAIVRQAAEAHGGWVQAANAPGGGALLSASFGAASGLAP